MGTKEYCSHCEHCNKIVNFKGKFDYSFSSIADSHTNNSTIIHLNKILEIINRKIKNTHTTMVT